MSTTTIQGTLTSLNEYIKEERTNKYISAKIKREETERCAWAFRSSKVKVTEPCYVLVMWYMPDKRKDPDNIAFGIKFILDGAVKAGALPDDTQKTIKSVIHNFRIDKENPRIEVAFLRKVDIICSWF